MEPARVRVARLANRGSLFSRGADAPFFDSDNNVFVLERLSIEVVAERGQSEGEGGGMAEGWSPSGYATMCRCVQTFCGGYRVHVSSSAEPQFVLLSPVNTIEG